MIRSFNGKTPKIAESAFISEAAYVIGDVEIGENSSVWPGAVIRADSGRVVIGKNTAIEDNCTLHSGSPPDGNLTIGDMVQIGHGAVLNCSKIANNVLIGMNATLLHEVEISKYCLIAAGCLVAEGVKIPENSFVVGVPGKVKGKIAEDQLWWVEDVWKHYIKLAAKYKKEQL
jgi:carbonic anhydrase/acetyltransferase-like protein (isoleucine patch superfamily)